MLYFDFYCLIQEFSETLKKIGKLDRNDLGLRRHWKVWTDRLKQVQFQSSKLNEDNHKVLSMFIKDDIKIIETMAELTISKSMQR